MIKHRFEKFAGVLGIHFSVGNECVFSFQMHLHMKNHRLDLLEMVFITKAFVFSTRILSIISYSNSGKAILKYGSRVLKFAFISELLTEIKSCSFFKSTSNYRKTWIKKDNKNKQHCNLKWICDFLYIFSSGNIQNKHYFLNLICEQNHSIQSLCKRKSIDFPILHTQMLFMYCIRSLILHR